ncbi:hypothetical protein ACFRCG_36080 [Embleya sp. NPDC056575]|uniref:hypothetical protein n=1 Tax=unclassified Embleya TaxID=2699296 RepID=UPI003676B823
MHLLREGSPKIGPTYLNELFQALAPDVFEDRVTVTARPNLYWPDDETAKRDAWTAFAASRPEYMRNTSEYDVHLAVGRDPSGVRWVMLKVYAKSPKHVDPDRPPSLP